MTTHDDDDELNVQSQVAWAGVVAYGGYFFPQVTSIGQVIVMGVAFVVPPVLLTIDVAMSQLVFVPLHFVFAVAFLFLWVLVLFAYTSVTSIIGNCSE